MTQSDSPDFEFDPTNLEVEGENASASEKGSATSGSEEQSKEKVSEEAAVPESISEEENYEGFAIDELPDSSAGVPAEIAGQDEVAQSKIETDSEESSPGVTRIEDEKPKSRSMGDDDLGADVFAEIDSDSGLISFEDVIDDLMDEVETYEAGGFVDLDSSEASELTGAKADNPFNLQDPDDSLSQFVDPDALESTPAAKGPKVPEVVSETPPSQPKANAGTPAPRPASGRPSDPESREVLPDVPPRHAPESRPEVPVAAKAESPRAPAEPVDYSSLEIPSDDMVENAGTDKSESEAPVDLQVSEGPPSSPEEVESSEDAAEWVPEPIEARETVFYSGEEDDEEIAAEPEPRLDETESVEDIAIEGLDAFEDEESEPDASEPQESIKEEENTPHDELAIEPGTESESAEQDVPLAKENLDTEATPESASSVGPETDSEEVVETGNLTDDSAAVAEEEVEAIELPEVIDSGALVEEGEPDEPEDTVESKSDEEVEVPVGLEVIDDDESEEPTEKGIAEEIESLEAAEEPPVASETEESIAVSDSETEEDPVASESIEATEAEGSESEELAADESPEVQESEASEAESEIDGLESGEAETTKSKTSGSTEDLLRFAGSVLNGGEETPAFEASSLLEEVEDDEVVAMPSPESLMAELGEDEDDEEVISLPDPASLMSEGGEGLAVIDGDDEDDALEETPSEKGNVADRAGDLPPPPPAPVEIIDEEPPEEDPQVDEAAEANADSDANDDSESSADVEEVSGIQDPFDSDISLADFDEGFGELEDLVGTQGDEADSDAQEPEKAAVAAKADKSDKVVELPKPGLLWRITHSLSIAAGFVLLGAASVLAVWRQEIVEFIEGRDIDGSALVQQVKEIGLHVMSDFGDDGLYRLQWLDSEVKRVSDNEIRLHAIVGAQLREDLFKPVLESELEQRFEVSEETLLASLGYAHENFPEEVGNFPPKPWDRLYEISAAKGKIIPLKVTYGLTRPSAEEEWSLARVKVVGYKEELKWPEGQPKYAFGENAYDIDSREFEDLIAGYQRKSESYIARIEDLKTKNDDSALALKRENERQRERVRLALSEGAYFNGVAIIGADAADSQDVQLVITEASHEGDFVKGVVRLSSNGVERKKHFVGNLDFKESYSGKEQGILNLRTIAFDASNQASGEVAFFDPSSVSRMQLKADGFRLEGDSPELSFRLSRDL